MAKFPTYEEIAKNVAEKALDEFLYNGKSIREWMQIITSEDAVSRQAVIDALNKTSGIRGDALKALYDLPLVAPQPKTGHWERVQYDGNPNIGNLHCSECNRIAGFEYNFCPNCGAKMQEV